MQISQGNIDNGQSNVESEMSPSGPSPEDTEDEKQDSEVPISDDGKQPAIEGTSVQIGQEIPIGQRVEEELTLAGIKMSTADQDLFIKFQNEIGTDIYFRKGPHRVIDGNDTLKATERYLEQNHPDMMDTWLEYKSEGKLTHELIDVLYAEERNQELHENKDYFLNKMEQLNIIVKARAFNENGVKEENYFFTPCMLPNESPTEAIALETDAREVSTSVLCWVIKGTSMLVEIFQKLIAACLARWPVAKKKKTSKSLIFQNCTVFNLDPVHRLFLQCDNHAVFARITRMGIDHVNAKMCTRVRKFITLNFSHQDSILEYQLYAQTVESQDITEHIGSRISIPIGMWFVDEVHDPTSPITREHMNHARLCVAIVTICGEAMRIILDANPPASYTGINHAIIANKTKLISRTRDRSGKWQKAILNKDQRKMLFPDPKRQFMATMDQLDISLLYTLIINISRVQPPSTAWGVPPQDRPRDTSLGANVERIHLYRNKICGHSADGKITQQDFEDYWTKIDYVLRDIDAIFGQTFSEDLENQRRQVISVYEAC
ncbi:hypothetical protein ACJMK2_015126 [Sinanodonta woodiana]|uniref:DZIP3-like HEPN domain-containing protein n=1 Tax=Sinanodonta woodiana TaxID=1069815 RepID=A0ABD3V2N9_SINWO